MLRSDEPLLQDMHKVKEVMEQRRQRMTVNGNETRAQRRVPASIDSLSVYQLDLLPFPFSISDPAGVL